MASACTAYFSACASGGAQVEKYVWPKNLHGITIARARAARLGLGLGRARTLKYACLYIRMSVYLISRWVLRFGGSG